MKPPSPDNWLYSLKVWEDGDLGIGIYVGVINDVDCPVVVIDETTLHVAIGRNAIWHFNRELGVFETVPRGSAQWSAAIIEEAGLPLDAGLGISLTNLDRNDIVFRLLPATP